MSLSLAVTALASALATSSPPLWHSRRNGVIPAGRAGAASLAPLVKAVKSVVVHVEAGGRDRAVGSGFVIDPSGWVVTNAHVVGAATHASLRLADGKVLAATVVGRDEATDLALLKLSAVPKTLPYAILGDSDALEVGDWVVAIGNPFGLQQSVSHGVVSAKERILGLSAFDDFLQTDVFMNPGSSGGPLFNLRGEVVGVTTARVNEGQGIGFAVPINLLKELLPQLSSAGRVARGWLGLTVEEVAQGRGTGIAVKNVAPGGPALTAGLARGDRIVALEGEPVRGYLWLLRRVALAPPKTVIHLRVLREGKPFDLAVTVSAPPPR